MGKNQESESSTRVGEGDVPSAGGPPAPLSLPFLLSTYSCHVYETSSSSVSVRNCWIPRPHFQLSQLLPSWILPSSRQIQRQNQPRTRIRFLLFSPPLFSSSSLSLPSSTTPLPRLSCRFSPQSKILPPHALHQRTRTFVHSLLRRWIVFRRRRRRRQSFRSSHSSQHRSSTRSYRRSRSLQPSQLHLPSHLLSSIHSFLPFPTQPKHSDRSTLPSTTHHAHLVVETEDEISDHSEPLFGGKSSNRDDDGSDA